MSARDTKCVHFSRGHHDHMRPWTVCGLPRRKCRPVQPRCMNQSEESKSGARMMQSITPGSIVVHGSRTITERLFPRARASATGNARKAIRIDSSASRLSSSARSTTCTPRAENPHAEPQTPAMPRIPLVRNWQVSASSQMLVRRRVFPSRRRPVASAGLGCSYRDNQVAILNSR